MNEAGDSPTPNRSPTRLAADVPSEEVAELKRRYLAGDTLNTLMKDFDGSLRTLRNVLRAAGVTFRPPQPITPPAPPGMVETYNSGKSIIETGRAFGLGRDITRRMLLEAGVRLRRGRPPKSAETDPHTGLADL